MQAQKQPSAQGTPATRSTQEHDLIRVVVQSPQVWNRKGLSRQLSPRHGFVLLQRSGTLDHVLADCERMAPCVLVIDQVLVQAEGFDPERFGTRVEFGRSIQVLIVGPKRDPKLIEDLLRAGCVGFVTEDTSPAVLRKAVKAVASGEFWADRRATSRVVQQLLSQSGARSLTPREKQVLWLIGQGHKNRAIAERLFITRDTVRWHIRGIYAKIGVRDRLSAALYAREHLESGRLDLPAGSTGSTVNDSALGSAARPPRFLPLHSRFRDE